MGVIDMAVNPRTLNSARLARFINSCCSALCRLARACFGVQAINWPKQRKVLNSACAGRLLRRTRRHFVEKFAKIHIDMNGLRAQLSNDRPRHAALYHIALEKRAACGDAFVGEIAEVERGVAALRDQFGK